MPRVPATRERGLRAGCRFYRQHFLQVFTLSLVFYSAMIVFAVLSVVELGYFGLFPIAYLMVASIFWLQAPLVRLVDDVHGGRANAGIRHTFESLFPRLGSITGGTLVAAICVLAAASFFVLPGFLLLARWSLFIPVIVLEQAGPFRAFGRSNRLVRLHSGRVIVELAVSTALMTLIWAIAYALLIDISSLWISIPIVLLFLTLTTPPIPLMRTLAYFDLVDASARSSRQASLGAAGPSPGPTA